MMHTCCYAFRRASNQSGICQRHDKLVLHNFAVTDDDNDNDDDTYFEISDILHSELYTLTL